MFALHGLVFLTLVSLLVFFAQKCWENDGGEVLFFVLTTIGTVLVLVVATMVFDSAWPIVLIGVIFISLTHIICKRRKAVNSNRLLYFMIGFFLVVLVIYNWEGINNLWVATLDHWYGRR